MLGAGFSCAYSSTAPTMGDFLQRASDIGVYQPNGSHRQLADIAERYFRSPIEVNIESLASLLALDSTPTLSPEKESRAAAYDQLIEIIEGTLVGIYDSPRTLEIKNLFTSFANRLVDLRIPVVTLNYDLLMDQLLKDTGQWLPAAGYGIELPLAGFTRNDASLNDEIRAATRRAPSKTVLLKLHGSLNWGRRNLKYSDGSHPLELSPAGALNPGSAQHILPIKNMSSSPIAHPGSYFWDTYIVPPFVAKSPGSGVEPALENIWYMARAALAQAQFIHFLGYSLPPSDFQMDILIREGFWSWIAHDMKKRVFVVDRESAVRERFACQFRQIEIDTSNTDISDYIARLIRS